MKKISSLVLLFTSCASTVFASDNCSTLSSFVNYSVENQIKTYCFDSEIDFVRNGFQDANIIIEGKKLSVSTYGQGTLFNIQIELKNGTQIDAAFLTAKAPLIKRVVTLGEDLKTVEIVDINK